MTKMTTKIKDGIYSVQPTVKNPFAKYAVIKTFPNGEVKQRFMECVNDCKQQLEEWDAELGIKNTPTTGRHRVKVNHYSLFDVESNKVVFEGIAREVASKFGCSPASVCNAALDGKRKLCDRYLVSKINVCGVH